MALASKNYQAKVYAYFKMTLGREPSDAEMSQWSTQLASKNGNVWTSGLAQQLNGAELASLVAGKLPTDIVKQFYANLTGAQPTQAILDYYVPKLANEQIKLKGLANAMLNDLALMPKADASVGQPANWGSDLRSLLPSSDYDSAIGAYNTYFKAHEHAFEGHRYVLVETPTSFLAAKAASASYVSTADGATGRLVTIESQAENDFVLGLVQKYLQNTSNLSASDAGGIAYVWLGADDIALEGQWSWHNNSSVNSGNSAAGTAGAQGGYANWGYGAYSDGYPFSEPDNSGNQDALAMGLATWPDQAMVNSSFKLGVTGQWNDISINNQMPYVIELA